MKTNLSSQIKLDRIPRRYYDPQDEIELAALTRDEKIYTRIFETVEEGSDYLAAQIARIIELNVATKGKCVMALGAGVSTHSAYSTLIRLHKEGKVNFRDVIVYNLAEFFPLVEGGPCTLNRLKEVLLDHIEIRSENIRTFDPDVTKEDMFQCCKAYEKAIEADGGLDLVVCEVGATGSLAFNEPGTPETSLCRLVLLGNETRHNVASDYKCDNVPTTAITLGIANILSAERVLTMAWGESRAQIIEKTVEEPANANVPAGSCTCESRCRPFGSGGSYPHITALEGHIVRVERQAHPPRHRVALSDDRQADP